MAQSEDKYEIPFKIISLAGDSRSKSLEAIEKAKKGDFEDADALVAGATLKMQEAHKFQFDLVTKECNGNPVDMNILLIHAEDHLSMAIETISLAQSFIFLARQVAELKK
jgi:Phosphotransferase system cellobiose-specific component IIA